MDCNTCRENRKNEPVPYIAHESAMARQERTVKRLVAAIIIVMVLWFATIGAFLLYINQYDFETYDFSQDGMGVNIIGSQNGVYNGPASQDPPQD